MRHVLRHNTFSDCTFFFLFSMHRLLLFRFLLETFLIYCAFMAAYLVRGAVRFFDFIHSGYPLYPWGEYQLIALGGTALLSFFLFASGHYSYASRQSLVQTIPRIFIVVSAWLLVLLAYLFLTRQIFFSRFVLVSLFFFAGGVLICSAVGFRLARSVLYRWFEKQKTILFVGSGPITTELAKELESSREYKILGVIDHQSGSETGPYKNLGSLSDFSTILAQYQPDEVLQTCKTDIGAPEETVYEICRDAHIAYRFVPDLFHQFSKNIETQQISSVPVLQIKPSPIEGWGRIVKGAFDRLAAFFGLIVLAPVLLVIALAVKYGSPGPIIYKSYRVGEKGRLIPFYKFRSMVINADALKSQLKSQRS